jgi:hypothetical protein
VYFEPPQRQAIYGPIHRAGENGFARRSGSPGDFLEKHAVPESFRNHKLRRQSGGVAGEKTYLAKSAAIRSSLTRVIGSCMM